MAWVALDRAVRSAEEFGLKAPLERWRSVRQTIHDFVCREGFDAEKNSFVQSYGSKELDASLLLLPLVGFLPPDDPRVRGTVAAIEREMTEKDLCCAIARIRVRTVCRPARVFFWPVASGSRTIWCCRSVKPRHARFSSDFFRCATMSACWLRSTDPRTKRQLGNFPQAFSHLALIGKRST